MTVPADPFRFPPSQSALSVGTRVVLKDLQGFPWLNGETGVVERTEKDNQRFLVRLERDGKSLKGVKSENLELLVGGTRDMSEAWLAHYSGLDLDETDDVLETQTGNTPSESTTGNLWTSEYAKVLVDEVKDAFEDLRSKGPIALVGDAVQEVSDKIKKRCDRKSDAKLKEDLERAETPLVESGDFKKEIPLKVVFFMAMVTSLFPLVFVRGVWGELLFVLELVGALFIVSSWSCSRRRKVAALAAMSVATILLKCVIQRIGVQVPAVVGTLVKS